MRQTLQRLVPRLVFILLLAGLPYLSASEAEGPQFTVKGSGFFKDRLLMQQLKTIFHETRTYFDAADIEDAALIIVSEIQSDGYLNTEVVGRMTQFNGEESIVKWDKELDVFLPGNTEAVSVHFQITTGPRFYYNTLETNHTAALSTQEVEAFFYSEPFFFEGDSSKVFTPALLNSGTQNLRIHLRNLGYQNAEVYSEVTKQDPETGATDVKISINEGPISVLKKVNLITTPPEFFQADFSPHLGKPYNTFLRQDIIQETRNQFYSEGYADVKIDFTESSSPTSSDVIEVVLQISIDSGSQYSISNIRFEGAETVRKSLLRKQLTFEEGDLFDPTQLNHSRLNLSRLGLFQKIEYGLEDLDDSKKNLTFQLRDRTTWELDALFGWGSYERLRLGLTAEKLNAFGLGHRLQFKSIVSNKSFLGESRYLIPHFLDTQFPFSTKLFYLEREELSFDREEFGINLGTSKYIKSLDLTMDAVYSFESLDAQINDMGSDTNTPDSVRSGSIEFRFSRDKRDNPLNPQSGYRLYGDFEWGSEALGGEVDYQAAELGLSYHKEIKRGLLWHGSISHVVVGSLYKSQSQIPTNKLLFPGGENSVRGYQRGEAAPRDTNSNFVGAQSYLLLNLELEQRLTNAISIVGFYDVIGTTADIEAYPSEEYLSSIGLGIRLRTFMGPIRLEYGHNLDQRPEDPDGTLHLTIGYPF